MGMIPRTAAALILAATAAAQKHEPAFAVASVRAVHEPQPGGFRHQITPDGIRMQAVSMRYCLRLAFGLTAQRPWELAGPAWMDPPTGLLFDISAKAPGVVSEPEIRAMLRTLLEQRFGLATHRERRSLRAYGLVVERKSRALRPSTADRPTKIRPGSSPYELLCEHVSMAQLALQLGPPMTSYPVIDRTAIAGSFDFTLDLGRYLLDRETGTPVLDANGMTDTEGATLRTLREQLGLALRAERAEFDVVVVDRINQRSTGN